MDKCGTGECMDKYVGTNGWDKDIGEDVWCKDCGETVGYNHRYFNRWSGEIVDYFEAYDNFGDSVGKDNTAYCKRCCGWYDDDIATMPDDTTVAFKDELFKEVA